MITPIELLNLYYESIDVMNNTFDPSVDGTSQKTFRTKYDSVLYSLMLYLLCTQITTRPMMITLKQYPGHPLYYSNNVIYNGDVSVPITSEHNIAIQSIIQEHPTRVYLFNNCTTPPASLTPKEKASINAYYSHLLTHFNPMLSVKMYKEVSLSRPLFQVCFEHNRILRNKCKMFREKLREMMEENENLKKELEVQSSLVTELSNKSISSEEQRQYGI